LLLELYCGARRRNLFLEKESSVELVIYFHDQGINRVLPRRSRPGKTPLRLSQIFEDIAELEQ
jgi:hypothetical protein